MQVGKRLRAGLPLATRCTSPVSSALNNHGYIGLHEHNHIFKQAKEPASAKGHIFPATFRCIAFGRTVVPLFFIVPPIGTLHFLVLKYGHCYVLLTEAVAPIEKHFECTKHSSTP